MMMGSKVEDQQATNAAASKIIPETQVKSDLAEGIAKN
jgi:hypothetical protein